MVVGAFDLDVVRLHADRVAEAWVLCRLVAPGLALERWAAFAAERLNREASGDGGILAAEGRQGALLGLLGYSVVSSAEPAAKLVVDLFIVNGLLRGTKDLIAAALAEAAQRIGIAADCRVIQLRADSPLAGRLDGDLASLLRARGYRTVGLDLCRELPSLLS